MIQTVLAVGILSAAHGASSGLEPRGDLVFASARDGDFEIYRMDLPSKSLAALTQNGAQDLDPCWTPDGKEILFVSNRRDRYELYVMEADGRNPKPLHRESGSIRRPAASPDGKWVAYTVFDQGEPEPGEGKVPPFGRVRLFNRATRRSYAVSPAGWSADDAAFEFQSQALYFSAKDKGPLLAKVSLGRQGQLGKIEPLLQGNKGLASVRQPQNGERLFLIQEGRPLWLSQGKTAPAFSGLAGWVRSAAFSPSGALVMAVKKGGQYDLWLAGPSGPQRLTDSPADDLSPSLK